MRSNTKAKSTPVFTHEGAPAALHLTPTQQLRRSVLSCLLFESEFYEDGQSIADRITESAFKCCGDDGGFCMHITNHFAIIRNLRNISEAGVSAAHMDKVRRALGSPEWTEGASRILPFRYVAAARACPQMEPHLDAALLASLAEMTPLSGKTIVLVDVSRSMEDRLSSRSDLTRMDAAAALAAIIPGEVRMFSFSDKVKEVPARKGMAGVDAIRNSQPHNSTALFDAVAEVQKYAHDRIIVITDEQATGATRFGHYIVGALNQMPAPVCRDAYVINVASNQNGVGYGPWKHIDGFSENVIRFIVESES